jgi:hypothetical protein
MNGRIRYGPPRSFNADVEEYAQQSEEVMRRRQLPDDLRHGAQVGRFRWLVHRVWNQSLMWDAASEIDRLRALCEDSGIEPDRDLDRLFGGVDG